MCNLFRSACPWKYEARQNAKAFGDETSFFYWKAYRLFSPKEKELQGQKHMIAQQAKITSNALEASYEVAYLIAQTKKPHTIGETLIKPAAVAMCRVIHGEK